MGQTNSHQRDQPLNLNKKKTRSTVPSSKAGFPSASSSSSSSSSSLQNDRRLSRSNTAPSIHSITPPQQQQKQQNILHSTKTLTTKPKTTPSSRNITAFPPRSTIEPTTTTTGFSSEKTTFGAKNKVMKENELISHLEQMGFARSVVLECLENFNVQKGKRTVIDPNVLIEQLIVKTKRTGGSDVSTSSIDASTFFEGLTSSSSNTHNHSNSKSKSNNNNNNNDNNDDYGNNNNTNNTNQSQINPVCILTPPSYINPFRDFVEDCDLPTQLASAPSSSTLSETQKEYINPFVPSPFNPFYESEVSSPRDKDYDSTKCKICFDRPVETVILKCAHSVMCMECSKGLKKCPICFSNIQQVIKIYTC